MQTYDFLMLLVLGGLTVYGYYKGMAWQVAYLASFVASYFVAVRFGDRFAPVFGDAAPWNKLIAMAVIYAATSLGIWMLFRVVRGAIDGVKLNSFDRQMGAFVGFARGVVWCLGITFVALTFVARVMPGVQQHIVQSRSGHYIAKFIDETEAIFPPEVHQVIGPYLEQIDRGLDPNQVRQPNGGLFSGLSGQIDDLSTQVGSRLQEQLRNLPAQLPPTGQAPTGWPPSGQPPTGQPLTGGQGGWPSTTSPGLPAWPTASGSPRGTTAGRSAFPPPAGQPAFPAATPATPAGWPAPPAGTGWPAQR